MNTDKKIDIFSGREAGARVTLEQIGVFADLLTETNASNNVEGGEQLSAEMQAARTEEYRKRSRWQICDLLQRQQVYTICVNHRTAGIVAYEFRHPHENRPVIELIRLAVLPGFQGKGLPKELIKQVIVEFQRQYPNGLLLVDSRNPVVIGMARNAKYVGTPITQKEYFTLCYGREPNDPDMLQRMADREAEGWKMYLLDMRHLVELASAES